MARPRTLPGPSTTERLLGAAEEVFGRLGFVRARLEDIAGAIGITRPSLLYHFDSKEALYSQVVRRSFGLLRGALETKVDAGKDFEELLDGTLDTYVSFLENHPAVASVLLREILEGRGPGMRFIIKEVRPLIDWLEKVFQDKGRNVLRPDVPVRAALLQISTASLVRITTPRSVRHALWGPTDHTRALAHMLFLGR